MSRFDETVAKIASSPGKCALLPQLPSLLAKKEAGVFTHLFGAGEATGAQAVARGMAGTVGGTAILAGAGYLANKVLDEHHGAPEMLSAERTQIGKLKGEHTYRHSLTVKLAPMHVKVFTSIKKDPVISKADPELIHSSYETMKRFAPHLAADENAARSFLRENAIYGTGPSYASLKNLADAEQSVGKASGLGG